MDTHAMPRLSAALLLLTAVGAPGRAGIRCARGRNPPSGLAMAHRRLARSPTTPCVHAAIAGEARRAAEFTTWRSVAAAGLVMDPDEHPRGRPLPTGLTLAHPRRTVLALPPLPAAVVG